MTRPLRRLSRDFAVYGLGEIVVKAFSLISLPVYTRVFNPAEFGVLSYVITLGGLLGAVLVLGGDSAYARFYFEARTVERRQLITSTWIGFLALWSVVVSLCILPFAGLIADASLADRATTPLFVATLLVGPISLVNRMCSQVLRNEFRATAFTVLNVAGTVLLVGFAVTAVLGFQMGVLGVLVGTLVAELVMVPVRLWTARSMFRPRFSLAVLRQLLGFGIPLVPTSLAYWVFLTSDRLILGKLSTLEQLGLYSVANSLVSLATIAIGAFGQAWTPHAIQLYEDAREVAAVIYGRVMTYLLAGFGLLAVGLSVFGPELLMVLTGPGYQGAMSGIAPLAIAMVAMASTQITAGGITLAKRTHYLAVITWVAAVLNVALNVMLDARFGMVGAAWATAAAYISLTLMYLVTAQRLWPVTYEIRRSATLIALILAFSLGAGLLPSGFQLEIVALKAAYLVGFMAATLACRAIDGRETREVWALMVRIRR
ncbi:MAG: oligosaccharide flippase family protein [Candidatus Limnocylindria bacterium]